ncbi:hypothetical protein GOP47_0011015 [Adiantum capillus-veneris]|uniref:Uncharacterized protein n=2 Tax=Adiantum capillus-veneris TaxID=13818 RepID=A0A9D4ZGY2_ADICA|nr:hypothetical protein GOP47_0011015 [Adiantum capillus-veneris]
MALPFPGFHTWLWKNPSPNPNPNPNPPAHTFPNTIPNHNFPVSSADTFAALDVDAFQLSRSSNEKNSSPQKVCGNAKRRVNKGAQRRRNHSLDLDFDMVIVQPNCFSGSESENSDWSVGWFEPHAPEFCSDGEPENSFAVIVPCYGSLSTDSCGGKARLGQEEASNVNCTTTSKSQLWAAVLSNIANDSHADTNFYLQQWVSSLQT